MSAKLMLEKLKENAYTIMAFIVMIGWMGLIFYFSSRTGSVSSAQSSQMQEMIFNVVPNIKDAYLKIAGSGIGIFHIRKLAHMFLYFMLAVFVYVFMYMKTKNFVIGIKISMLISVVYAALDEIHQLYVVGRSGQLTDVWVDSIGVFIAIVIISIVEIVRSKKQIKESKVGK